MANVISGNVSYLRRGESSHLINGVSAVEAIGGRHRAWRLAYRQQCRSQWHQLSESISGGYRHGNVG